MNINWIKLENSISTFKAYKIETNYSIFYTIEMLGKSFFLVNYDKVLQSYTPYCIDKSSYELMMNIFLIFSDYTYCEFYIEEDLIVYDYEDIA
jgi:hypothetical protein